MNTILQLHFTEEKGDILAFLTGQVGQNILKIIKFNNFL